MKKKNINMDKPFTYATLTDAEVREKWIQLPYQAIGIGMGNDISELHFAKALELQENEEVPIYIGWPNGTQLLTAHPMNEPINVDILLKAYLEFHIEFKRTRVGASPC